jgi:RES domain-containing protein
MIVYRLSKAIYASDLSGKGAELAGGRWNSKGTAMVYTGESRALCTAEIAVHTPLGNLPIDYCMVSIEIPEHVRICELSGSELPSDWRLFPHPHTTQETGDIFIRENTCAVLRVPSVVVQGEYNYLLNPSHPDFHAIKVIAVLPFSFDERLFIRSNS